MLYLQLIKLIYKDIWIYLYFLFIKGDLIYKEISMFDYLTFFYWNRLLNGCYCWIWHHLPFCLYEEMIKPMSTFLHEKSTENYMHCDSALFVVHDANFYCSPTISWYNLFLSLYALSIFVYNTLIFYVFFRPLSFGHLSPGIYHFPLDVIS